MANGIEAGAMIRPVKNPWLNRDYLACVEAGGRPVVGRDGAGLREFVRHLRRGGVMALLLDQYTKRGLPIDFLGHPAPSGTTVAELALKYDLPMIPVYGTRQPDGIGVAVEFEAPIPPTTRRGDDPGRRRQPRRPRPRPSRTVLLAAPALGEAALSGPSADRAIHAAPTATWKDSLMHKVCTTYAQRIC